MALMFHTNVYDYEKIVYNWLDKFKRNGRGYGLKYHEKYLIHNYVLWKSRKKQKIESVGRTQYWFIKINEGEKNKKIVVEALRKLGSKN